MPKFHGIAFSDESVGFILGFISLSLHNGKYNFDISGESNQRNKFVKCSEHYFSGREFIVYVQVSPALGRPALAERFLLIFYLLTPRLNEIKIFDPRAGKGRWDGKGS